jgi:hypothetical protein
MLMIESVVYCQFGICMSGSEPNQEAKTRSDVVTVGGRRRALHTKYIYIPGARIVYAAAAAAHEAAAASSRFIAQVTERLPTASRQRSFGYSFSRTFKIERRLRHQFLIIESTFGS